MTDVRNYQSGIQVIYAPANPPVRIYQAGIQVIRYIEVAPGPKRRLPFTIIN